MSISMFGMQAQTAQEMASSVIRFFSKYTLSLIGSAIILIVGWLFAILVGKFLKRKLIKHRADVTIIKFLVQIVEISVVMVALLTALGNLGITIAPFIAGLGVLGFGTSFALQGPLSNYAAGVSLIFTKPFEVGDIIEFGEYVGQVEDITLARVIIMTLDGTRIIIPNKKIIGEVLHNYSDFKQLDIKVGVSYNSDVDKAIRIVKDIISDQKNVSQKPPPKVGISELADSSINIYARIWCKQTDYWDLLFTINKEIYNKFGKEGVVIPFPQRDVHLYNNKKEDS
ncbi:MAG: mechanosensitive ion channel family protein [Candidatus Omnitrophica bacterium]|nr:mechanosensitive ion channel family protein [Candidatus Omnitrophota bacterium]